MRGTHDEADARGEEELMITVAIADDQTLIRATLAATLGLEDDLEVVAQAGTVAAAPLMQCPPAGFTKPCSISISR